MITEAQIREVVFSKDISRAYQKMKEFTEISKDSDELYHFFDTFTEALHDTKSCVRARGFKLILMNAKWDTNNLIDEYFPDILAVLDDDNATVVRQCLPLLRHIGDYKKELASEAADKLSQLKSGKYKESMQSLIAKDIAKIRSFLSDA